MELKTEESSNFNNSEIGEVTELCRVSEVEVVGSKPRVTKVTLMRNYLDFIIDTALDCQQDLVFKGSDNLNEMSRKLCD